MSAIGSKEWFTEQADKCIDGALEIVKYKIVGGEYNGVQTGDAANTSNRSSTLNSGMMDKLPYILGGLAVVGIAVILIKR